MKLLEWSLWLGSAIVFATSGPRADLPLHALQSTEGVASALHAAPTGAVQAGTARASTNWSGARAPVGTPLPATRVLEKPLSPRISITAARTDAPDTEGVALGFLAERSLAPPRLG